MNGVETRIAPPSMAMRTVTTRGVHVRSLSRFRPEDRETPIERLGDQQHDEDQSLKHQHGRVGQTHAPLNQAARGDEPAEQDRDRRDDQRIVAGEERHENAGEAVTGGERRVGAPLDGRDLEKSRQPGAGAGDRRAADDEPADRQPLRERGAKIAARDPRREAEGRARHQEV